MIVTICARGILCRKNSKIRHEQERIGDGYVAQVCIDECVCKGIHLRNIFRTSINPCS